MEHDQTNHNGNGRQFRAVVMDWLCGPVNVPLEEEKLLRRAAFASIHAVGYPSVVNPRWYYPPQGSTIRWFFCSTYGSHTLVENHRID
jgi:hypothetical protein